MTRGKFITLEGGDGAGKSTQVRRLASVLRRMGKKVIITREVGGSPGAEAIRELWLTSKHRWGYVTELLLIFAARRDHLEKTVWPALKKGTWVISDRFVDSTYAYQGFGLGVSKTLIDVLYSLTCGDFKPDLTIVLDQPVEAGMARMRARRLDRYEKKALAFHRRLRQGFLKLAKLHPKRITVVDAGQTISKVSNDIIAIVKKRLYRK